MADYYQSVNGIAPGCKYSDLTPSSQKFAHPSLVFPSEMSGPLIKSFQLPDGSVPPEMVPVGRLGEEKDMAAAILSLASQGGAYYNGNVVIVDGGRLQLAPATF